MGNGLLAHLFKIIFVDLSKLIIFCTFTFGAPVLIGSLLNVNPDPIGATWGDVFGLILMVVALMVTGYVMSILIYKNSG